MEEFWFGHSAEGADGNPVLVDAQQLQLDARCLANVQSIFLRLWIAVQSTTPAEDPQFLEQVRRVGSGAIG